jgi:hypothetical protein
MVVGPDIQRVSEPPDTASRQRANFGYSSERDAVVAVGYAPSRRLRVNLNAQDLGVDGKWLAEGQSRRLSVVSLDIAKNWRV